MKSLEGAWTGIVGGTNVGKVSAKLQQVGNSLRGEFIFDDLVTFPLQIEMTATLTGRRFEGSLTQFTTTQIPPVGVSVPQSGRLLGIVEEDGNKISGFWITDVHTTGAFMLLREG